MRLGPRCISTGSRRRADGLTSFDIPAQTGLAILAARVARSREKLVWWLRLLAPALLVVVAITLFCAKAIAGPSTYLATYDDSDVADTFRPHAIFQFEVAQQQRFVPQWNDRAGLGEAELGQFGTYYPPRVVAMLVAPSLTSATDVLVWLHLLLAGLAAMALAQLYGVSRWSAALVGVAYGLSHLAVRWAPFFHAPAFFAAFPIALIGLELVWRRRTLLGVPLLALGIGITGLGSHLQNTFLLLQALGVVALWRLVLDPPPDGGRWRPLGFTALGYALGLVIASPLLVPFALEQSDSIRQQAALSTIDAMNATSVLSAFDPLRGLAPTGINSDLYLGLAAPAALAGVIVAVRNRRLSVLLAVLALALLIGFKTPLLSLLVDTLPGWNVLSNVQRVSFVMVLPLAILLGLGVDAIVRWSREWAPAVAGGLIVAAVVWWELRMGSVEHASWVPAALAAVAALLMGWASLRRSAARRAALTATVVPIALLAMGTATAMAERGLGWSPQPDAPPAQFQPWIPLVRANDQGAGRWMSYCVPTAIYAFHPEAFLEAGGRWLDSYNSFLPKQYLSYWEGLTRSRLYVEAGTARALYNMDLRTFPLPNETLVNAAGITRILGDAACPHPPHGLGWRPLGPPSAGWVVYDNPGAFPMAYVSRRWQTVRGGPGHAVAVLAAKPPEFARHADVVEASLPHAPGGAPIPAPVERHDPQEVTVDLPHRHAGPALLVFLDSYDIAWHAYVDGRRRTVIRVNGTFRGVTLKPEDRQVVFRFDPWWDSVLPPIAWTLGGVLLALLGVGLWRARREFLPGD
jgi:hypothetical protein